MAQNEARKAREDEARKMLQEQREEQAKVVAEAAERAETTQPTPTQEENDLAKLGVPVEHKEDDRSGQTVITRSVVANEPLPAHGYETRAAREKRETRERETRERQTRRQSE